MDKYDIEECDDWHKDLMDWEKHQDELERITSELTHEDYWDPVPDWLQEWKNWYKNPDHFPFLEEK